MLTRLIGDIHGMFNDYKTYAIGNWQGPTIQIGDFGIGFGQGEYWHDAVNAFHSDGNHRFIRGNHDNPTRCKSMSGYIADGTVENDVMYVGGAWSIDNPNAPPGWYRRTPGVNWWEDEQCSDTQFEHMLSTYAVAQPRIMITHDCPASIAKSMFWDSGFIRGPQYYHRTGDWLDRFLAIHQPQEWYFGHWHRSMQYKQGNTLFHCIGELDFVDVQL